MLIDGVAFGKQYFPACVVYYLGKIVLERKRPHDRDFIKKVNSGTWPRGWLYVVKEGKFLNKRGKWIFERRI